MRGFDYRCPAGLALLIAKQLDSKRALRQAFSRVGRYNDICARFVLPTLGSLAPIDQEQEQELLKNITKGIMGLRPTPKEKTQVAPTQTIEAGFAVPKPPAKKD